MSVVFAIVDIPGEKLWRQSFFGKNTPGGMDMKTGLRINEKADKIPDPTPQGLYILPEGSEFHKSRMDVMKQKMEKFNVKGKPPRIVGPFMDDPGDTTNCLTAMQKAKKAQGELAPDSPEEAVKKVKMQKERLAEQAKELDGLRDQLAALEKEKSKRKKED